MNNNVMTAFSTGAFEEQNSSVISIATGGDTAKMYKTEGYFVN
jgi:hypothetical protein